jgi:hypothetical protein
MVRWPSIINPSSGKNGDPTRAVYRVINYPSFFVCVCATFSPRGRRLDMYTWVAIQLFLIGWGCCPICTPFNFPSKCVRISVLSGSFRKHITRLIDRLPTNQRKKKGQKIKELKEKKILGVLYYWLVPNRSFVFFSVSRCMYIEREGANL